MSAPILFQQVTVVSPSHRETGPVDVLFCDGRWHFPEKGAAMPEECRIIDARGKILLPGLFDLHAHLREPGREDAETIASGTAAAVTSPTLIGTP